MASSVGTFVTIDFKSTENPVINKVEFDFSQSGHSLCIVDTGGNHSDLTEDYAAVRGKWKALHILWAKRCFVKLNTLILKRRFLSLRTR